MKNTKKMVTAALLAAFTCIATMIIKIPTPTFGYIHLGDGLVLLCGIILGPAIGALPATSPDFPCCLWILPESGLYIKFLPEYPEVLLYPHH